MIQLARAARRTGDVAEVLGDARVAVDGDETALGAQRRGDRLRVTAGAEGAVDGDLALRRAEQLEQLVEKYRGVS